MLRVLLIDDNLDDRTLVIRQLEREFDTIEIEQIIDRAGFEAALQANRFDIAITDYQLIWSNGLTILRQLKATCPACPVIMFTNSTTQEEAIEAMKAGLDDYIVKSPRHYIRLASTVKLALERAADRQKAEHLELRLEELLNHLHVGVFRATLEGVLLEANTTFLQLLGVQTLAEAQSLKLNELFLHPQVQPTDRAQSLESASAASEQSLEQSLEQGLGREVQLKQANGNTVWVALNRTMTAVGRELFIEGLVQDISDRKALESAVQRQAETLAQANRLKDEFLTTLYHELRTPLNAILGWSKLLRTQPRSNVALVDRALEVIERNAIKQTNIVEDILDVAQVIQGKLQLNIAPIHLEKILTTVVAGVYPAVEAKSIDLAVHLDPTVGRVWGDKNRLQQIVWNLLMNAVKFTPAGGRIEVRLEQVGCGSLDSSSLDSSINGTVQLQVKDTGVGIRPEFLPYVFDRFSQADGSITRAYGGTGLGLAIVRHFVELQGGTVRAESPGIGQGATFTVQFPLANLVESTAPFSVQSHNCPKR